MFKKTEEPQPRSKKTASGGKNIAQNILQTSMQDTVMLLVGWSDRSRPGLLCMETAHLETFICFHGNQSEHKVILTIYNEFD